MRLSQAFLPILKEIPAEASIASHRWMLRAGLVRQTASGIYAWLPLGLKVLENIARIVREEQDAIGAQEVLMPTLQPADLWRRSGRYDAYGPEMLRIKDRHDRELLYGPTNEEMITDLFADGIKSYKQLPQYLYQLQWKFRDEIRPRFGVMRGREFYMKDGYSFDLSAEDAEKTYFRIMIAYLRTFHRLGVSAVPMAADTGPIGGKLSHEFLVLAPTGESEVFYDKGWTDDLPAFLEKLDACAGDVDKEVELVKHRCEALYAATEELHEDDDCVWRATQEMGRAQQGRGIEVGHIFSFGDKYTAAMGVSLPDGEGGQFHPVMGSYGIGVSRLVGAIIESSHDEQGIIWPENIAPYRVQMINLGLKNETCLKMAEDIYKRFPGKVLYDDRSERAGVKFNDADLLGMPWQIVIGPREAERGFVELKNRKTGEKEVLSLSDAIEKTKLDA